MTRAHSAYVLNHAEELAEAEPGDTLTITDRAILVHLAHTATGNGLTTISQGTAALYAGCHRISAMRSINELVRKGYLIRHGRGRWRLGPWFAPLLPPTPVAEDEPLP